MKKRPVELFYLLTLILDGFACAMLTTSSFGVSVLSSLPYVLSHIFTSISYGMFSFLVQVILLIILISITKQFKITYFMSFIVGFVYGVFLDMFMYLLSFIPLNIPLRILMFVLGFYILCKVQASYFKSELPLMPFDAFVADLVHYTNLSVFKVKTFQDMSFLITSTILSLVFFKRIIGIGLGTVCIAFLTGIIQQKIVDHLNKYFIFETKTKWGEKLRELAKVEAKN